MKTVSLTNLRINTSSHTLADILGLCVLYSLLLIQPFHFTVTEKVTYYREIFAIIFSFLIFPFFIKSDNKLTIRKEVFYVFLFLFALIIFALFDTGNSLYGEDYSEGLSENISNINPTLYVLRNAILYIPMVCYLSLRGLSEKELKFIAGIMALVAPLSIVLYLYKIELFPLFNIMSIVGLGDSRYIAWNSYVPYLTFPFIASLYLIVSMRHKIVRLLFLAIGQFLFLFILASASRQSVSFCVLMTLLLLVYLPTKNKVTLLLVIFGAYCIIYAIINYTFANYIVSDVLLTRYESVGGFVESRRYEIMRQGLELLNIKEFLIGTGLSSAIVGGPHNDFIRWTQRVGFPAMVLSFLPFSVSLLRTFRSMRQHRNSPMLFFIFSGLIFTIFHSFFGYPREDAYQALYAFLGLGLWLAISNNKTIATLNNSHKNL